jgi:hypothetical protein
MRKLWRWRDTGEALRDAMRWQRVADLPKCWSWEMVPSEVRYTSSAVTFPRWSRR